MLHAAALCTWCKQFLACGQFNILSNFCKTQVQIVLRAVMEWLLLTKARATENTPEQALHLLLLPPHLPLSTTPNPTPPIPQSPSHTAPPATRRLGTRVCVYFIPFFYCMSVLASVYTHLSVSVPRQACVWKKIRPKPLDLSLCLCSLVIFFLKCVLLRYCDWIPAWGHHMCAPVCGD